MIMINKATNEHDNTLATLMGNTAIKVMNTTAQNNEISAGMVNLFRSAGKWR